jgi:S1-C subfamily serine protease
MKAIIISVLLACAVVAAPLSSQSRAISEQADLQSAFERLTGVQLVFERADLPDGQYLEIMLPLSAIERVRAARIAIDEAKKYPAGHLKAIGLKYIGIFRGCASTKSDGYRPYDPTLQGYRYYGLWNGRDALVAAYYSNHQLPLTLHHELFHNIAARTADDGRFADAVAGRRPYPAPTLSDKELANLRAAGRGAILKDVVSDYCRKNESEDKAETARYLMSHLPDALVQVATRPELSGSQRLLHVLATYDRSQPQHAMNIQWFVATALGRKTSFPIEQATPVVSNEDRRFSAKPRIPVSTPVQTENPYLKYVDDAINNEALRNAIRHVQPACVRLDNASGVNLASNGYILTAAHVARRIGETLTARLPDGRAYPAKCIAIDHLLDLAVLRAESSGHLPYAPLAPKPPVVGSRVVCIGQPGSTSPSGKPTHYSPFTVSTGKIRELMEDPLGDQSLGRVSHDAWTYWGHSGSPLFDTNGQIVAMHNSWDSKTSLRHAVPYEAIVHFLNREHIPYSIAD